MGTLFFLKSGSFSPQPGQKVLKAADYAVLAQAEDIVRLAELEAESIRAAAKEAYEAEKQRGYSDGLEAGKLETAAQMMDTVAAGVDYLAGLETRIVDLVMHALRKIIDGFDDKERVLGLVRKALGYARSQKRVVLRVCPEEAEIVQEHLRDLLRDFPGIGILDVAPDPRLDKGACVLESELGLIDAGLDVQLANIRKAFQRQLQARQRDA
jgi:type III secretion protein L